MSLPDKARAVLGQWWDYVQTAVNLGMSTATTQAAIAELADTYSIPYGFDQATGIAQLYGYASRMQRATANLAAAQPEMGFTSSWTAQAPWSRPEQSMNSTPMYQIRYQVNLQMADGSVNTMWWTAKRSVLPDTKAGILDLVNVAAEQQSLASTSQQTPIESVISTGSISILAV